MAAHTRHTVAIPASACTPGAGNMAGLPGGSGLGNPYMSTAPAMPPVASATHGNGNVTSASAQLEEFMPLDMLRSSSHDLNMTDDSLLDANDFWQHFLANSPSGAEGLAAATPRGSGHAERADGAPVTMKLEDIALPGS